MNVTAREKAIADAKSTCSCGRAVDLSTAVIVTPAANPKDVRQVYCETCANRALLHVLWGTGFNFHFATHAINSPEYRRNHD